MPQMVKKFNFPSLVSKSVVVWSPWHVPSNKSTAVQLRDYRLAEHLTYTVIHSPGAHFWQSTSTSRLHPRYSLPVWKIQNVDCAFMVRKFLPNWTVCVSFDLVHVSLLKVLHNNFKQNCFQCWQYKKCFLSSKSANYNDFWRIMWHWRLD